MVNRDRYYPSKVKSYGSTSRFELGIVSGTCLTLEEKHRFAKSGRLIWGHILHVTPIRPAPLVDPVDLGGIRRRGPPGVASSRRAVAGRSAAMGEI